MVKKIMDSKKLEEFLKDKILPDLEKSRGSFDKIHTLEVVDWLKKIIAHNLQLELDDQVLLIAAYAHDWGYADLFKEGEVMQFEKVENAKKLHMELGAKKLEKLLEDDFFSFLTDRQKERSIHLVAVHDKKFELKDVDELILMEADMLSSLDIDTEKPVFDAESNKKFMEAMLTTRIPKFITEFSKKEADRLVRAREDYYNKIIQTAWLTAYPRIFSDIPLSAEIFQELEKIRKEQGDSGVPGEFKVPKLAPELEARYKLVNRLLAESNCHQILELAPGLSPRGFIMSQDPSINYVELDLAQMIDEKRKIIESLTAQSKLALSSNLHLLAGNALDPKDLAKATAHFKEDQPIAVINEGLLRYLSFPEKTVVAKNIYNLLKTYGGLWITPDITLRKLLETQNEITMPGKNQLIAELTSKNIDQNRFENEKQAKIFFEKLGFSVERYGLSEVASELVSPERLNIAPDEVKSMIGPGVVFVMRAK